RELGCDWHTVMDAVVAYGTPLIDDPDRIGEVTALGLDETLFARTGPWRTQQWCTSIVDVGRPAQLLDVVPGRTAAGPSAWLDARPAAWRARIGWGGARPVGPLPQDLHRQPPAGRAGRGPVPSREARQLEAR